MENITDSFTKATASGFAEWVFHANNPIYRNSPFKGTGKRTRYYQGKVDHRDIELFKLWMENKFPGEFKDSKWELVYADPHNKRQEKVFTASKLLVGDRAMRCVPDVVLRNKMNGHILIIERKTTMTPEEKIPEFGWPNMAAQLWCYSWIDNWVNAPEVWLIGQIWGRERGGLKLVPRYPRWRRNNFKFHTYWLREFQKYGGSLKEN